ncbi:ankyrin repeat-containing domain protein [Microdochium trichocladiopsis]|uniref:Ankyrin repeat-containing domain protein n=1 Tax=Microdochium trichocladiopsis TaxID=1682393 RepID=A0A9P8XTK2_9PEZI|nr:ankyrin repeat-containing domain protein [Microdochium trichocladiopsis]KAH7014331.1 ankyrin repeat-containing domain protein [Microdochium trichocladiopsis]
MRSCCCVACSCCGEPYSFLTAIKTSTMSGMSFSALSSVSSHLASKAQAGSNSIDHLLSTRSHDTIKTELDKLGLLSVSLRQLEYHAGQVPGELATDPCLSSLSAELSTELAVALPLCEYTLAVVIKQLSRLDENTPRHKIDVSTVSRFDAFTKSSITLYIILRGLLNTGDLVAVEAKESEARQALQDVQTAAGHASRNCDILSGADSSRTTRSDANGGPAKGPQAREHPPLTCSELPQYSDRMPAVISPGTNVPEISSQSASTSQNKDSASATGFFDSLTSSFKAMTAAIRFKPEPFVVPLCEAATRGSIPQIQGLLGEGVNVDGHNEAGLTALICAIQARQLEAARYLLQAGADPKIRSSGRKGKPPLYHASVAQYEPAVDLLLTNGASMAGSDDWFLDLLTGAASADWIALLLTRGASVHAKDSSGRVAIALALQHRKKKEDGDEVVATLLAHGADPNARDLYGTPLVHLCLQQDRDNLMTLLLERGANVNGTDMYGSPLVVEVLKRGNVALVKALITRGADVNSTDIYGNRLIINTITSTSLSTTDKAALVEILTQRGVQGGVADNWGVTALDYAVANTASKTGPLTDVELRVVDLLTSHGADPNQRLTKQPGYPTLLTYALDRQDWKLFRVALSRGAQPNITDNRGRTPLLIALQYGEPEVVALLIEKGADKNQAGQVTPVEMARASRDPQLMQLLGVPPVEGARVYHTLSREVRHRQGRGLNTSPRTTVEMDLPPQYEERST